MKTKVSRKQLVCRFLETAIYGSFDPRDREAGATRLATAFAQTLEVSAPGVELTAHVTDEMQLEVAVRVTGDGADVEAALRERLERDRSLIAAIVLADWREVSFLLDRVRLRRTLASTRPETMVAVGGAA